MWSYSCAALQRPTKHYMTFLNLKIRADCDPSTCSGAGVIPHHKDIMKHFKGKAEGGYISIYS